VANRGQADAEARRELHEAEPPARGELEPPDLGTERAVDAVLDGGDFEGGEERIDGHDLTFDQRFI